MNLLTQKISVTSSDHQQDNLQARGNTCIGSGSDHSVEKLDAKASSSHQSCQKLFGRMSDLFLSDPILNRQYSSSGSEISESSILDDATELISTELLSDSEDDDDGNDQEENANQISSSQEEALDHRDIDEVLSNEILKVSSLERNDFQDEIHGVRCLSMEESPTLLRRALHDFQRELEALPEPKKVIYHRIATTFAQETSKTPVFGQAVTPPGHYAMDEASRLRFLRAEGFRPKQAVIRFLNYLDFVNEHWGFYVVSRQHPIRLSDFSKDELKFFKKGYFQLLPFRDRSGRRVLVILGENHNSSNHKTKGGNKRKKTTITKSNTIDPIAMAKCYFYMLDVATRDSVESQQKGVIVINHPSSIFFDSSKIGVELAHHLHKTIPSRVVASHNFCPDVASYTFLAKAVVSASIQPDQILRQKFHVNRNDTNMRYHLLGFGIPVPFFPTTDSGTIKLNFFHKWVKIRRYLESQEGKAATSDSPVVVVECPLLNDVVFRQGKAYKSNPGNDILRDSIVSHSLVQQCQPPTSSSRPATTTLTTTEQFCRQLVQEVLVHRHGRFLTWDTSMNTWIEMHDHKQIRRKISVTLYNFEKRHKTLETSGSQPKTEIAGAVVADSSTRKRRSSSISIHSASLMAEESLAPSSLASCQSGSGSMLATIPRALPEDDRRSRDSIPRELCCRLETDCSIDEIRSSDDSSTGSDSKRPRKMVESV